MVRKISLRCARAGWAISRVGNDIFETMNSVKSGQYSVFLISGKVQQHGAIFAYRTYIANASNMVAIQLWRPDSSSTNLFQLVDVVHYSANKSGSEDVSRTLHNLH